MEKEVSECLSYKEYPIRCRSCGRLVDCYVKEYTSLVQSGLTKEEALNELGCFDYMCRTSFLLPVTILHDSENVRIIEGYSEGEVIVGNSVFGKCIDASDIAASKIEYTRTQKKSQEIPEIFDDEDGIDISDINITVEKVYPDKPGIPVVWAKRGTPKNLVEVGHKKTAEVLNGCTFLAV